jgi:hypothetical protein
MIIQVIGDEVDEFRYESNHVPAIGDRIVFEYFGYRVIDRTWRIGDGIVELWTEKE